MSGFNKNKHTNTFSIASALEATSTVTRLGAAESRTALASAKVFARCLKLSCSGSASQITASYSKDLSRKQDGVDNSIIIKLLTV